MRYTENGAEMIAPTHLLEAIELIKAEFENDANDDMDEVVYKLAQDSLPFISGEIIYQWQRIPAEYWDRWSDFAPDEWISQQGICGLMQIDLEEYYRELFDEALTQVRTEKLEELAEQ